MHLVPFPHPWRAFPASRCLLSTFRTSPDLVRPYYLTSASKLAKWPGYEARRRGGAVGLRPPGSTSLLCWPVRCFCPASRIHSRISAATVACVSFALQAATTAAEFVCDAEDSPMNPHWLRMSLPFIYVASAHPSTSSKKDMEIEVPAIPLVPI